MGARFTPRNAPAYAGRPETSLGKLGVCFPAFPTLLAHADCDHHDMALDVLVVDDDPWFRTVASRLLESAGFVVAGEADTARRAMAAVLDLAPAAVLLDVGLPDGDGVSLAGELAALPSPPRIVLTSSDPDAVTDELARRSGADAFVPKQELTDARLQTLFAVG
jgi:CheY-like chemotaxis protein